MNLFKYINKFFSIFDVYGQTVQLQFHLNSLFRTILGGFVSLIFYLIYLAIFLWLFSDVNQKNNQIITTYYSRFPDPPKFNITTNIEEFDYENKPDVGFFFYAVSFQDSITGEFYDEETISKYFYLEALEGVRNATTKKFTYPRTFKFINCSKIYSPGKLEFLKEPELINSLCLNETQVTVEGDFVSQIYNFLSFKIKDCQSSIFLKTDNITCYTTKEIKTKKSRTDFNIYYSEHKINPTIHDKSPIENVLMKLTTQLNQYMYQKYDIYLSKLEFKSEDNLYIPGIGIFSQPVIWVNRIVKSLSNPDKTSLAFYLRSEYYTKTYLRTYKSIVEFISEVGGIWKVVVFLGGLLVIPINVKLLQVALANDMFNIIPPKTNIKEQNYQYFKSLGTTNEPHKIIKLHNKTRTECEIAIEYYKYERNKGINYSLKEAIYGLFLICWKNEKIIQKDLIFNYSNRLLRRNLNITSILHFSKEINLIKNSILLKKDIFMRYSHRSVVHDKFMTILRLKFDQLQRMKKLNSEDKALLKEYDLINGIRALREKPVLDNIDFDLIKMLNISQKLLEKYFLNHKNLLFNNKNV